ncbi:Vitamin B12 import ATP-binding protein BtuD [Roseobacter fucihabitans]|uniref:Vitamin B12 import ATP-binding protein BtuD n=1 Tax=Roseobacter fucihabitans TaxID=1537242 RepID=A0ABZ2BZH1_9RHOB|nr:ATP-binding cassette domain-containing protein [Roseobacter litoralis]MBC6968286.1 Toxin RTX-I translocation ATP-binding protein [Roseobacter litoralis]
MMPFILKPQYRVTTRDDASQRATLDWEYDRILDGLLSGNISGKPMDSQDARLLLTLLERLGWIPDANRLAGAMPYLIDRLDPYALRGLMRNLGFECRSQKLHSSNIPNDSVAGLMVGPGKQLWAIKTIECNVLAMARPGVGEKPTNVRLFNPTKKYEFVHFMPDPKLDMRDRPNTQEQFTSGAFSRLAPDLRLAMLLTLLSGGLTVLFSIMVIFLFDLAVTGQQSKVIGAVLAAAGALFLFDLSFRMLKARLLGRVSGRFEFLLGGALFAKLLKLPRQMIDQAPLGEQTARLRELEGMRDIFAGPFALIALEIPGTLIMIGAITIFSPMLALVLLGVVVMFFIAGLCIVPALIRRAAQLSAARNHLTRLQTELIEKRDVLAQNGLAWTWTEKAERAISRVVAARFRLASAASGLEAISYLFLPTAATSVIFIGAERAIAGVLSGGELVAVTMLTWRAVAPLQQGLLIIPKIGDLKRLFRQVDMMMRFAEEDNLPEMEKMENKAARVTAANLVLRGPNTHAPILAGVSLEIPKGLIVSVVGVSGSGKSALLGVLSGQIQPQAGSVRLDSVNLSEMSSQELGRHIVLVPQRPLLIYGTFAQNLRFIDPLFSDDQIETILAEVGLSRLLKKLPRGIHTRIDPSLDVTWLSGGVRTAVAVAQALMSMPSVLLLDEASEDVEPEIDIAIIGALKRRQHEMTSLIVTHRPSMVRSSDAVLQIAGGRTSTKFKQEKKDQAV